jgi:hypothetical protein
MSVSSKVCYGAESAGCWFDGHRGIYIGDAVIETAIDHGWVCDVKGEDAGPYQTSPTWTEHEHYHELWGEAEEFMQQFAEEGFYFGGSEGGDWGLWQAEED